jgi:hypothetical protein
MRDRRRKEMNAVGGCAVHCADRRRLAHRAAADGQHRARGLPGLGRGARRDPVPAYEQHGRDAGAADRERRQDRPAHPAGASHEETGVTQTVDPLGGSYFIESLTDKIEAEAQHYIDDIDAQGGVLAAIERGYFRRAIAESATVEAHRIENQEQVIVGVNRFRDEETPPIDILRIGEEVEHTQKQRLAELRTKRDAKRHADALRQLSSDAHEGRNVMPALVQAAQADATVGEMITTLRDVFGTYDGGPEW